METPSNTTEPAVHTAGDRDSEVTAVEYAVHVKPGRSAACLRARHLVQGSSPIDEFVPIEHGGFARQHAVAWWAARCALPLPSTAVQALRIAKQGLLAVPKRIVTRKEPGNRWPTIVEVELGVIPDVDSEED